MLIGYSRPEANTPTIVGTGASFITPSDDLFNGRPADATRIQWLSGAQTTASVVQIETTWDTPIVPGLVGLFGFNPFLASAAGIKIVFMGKRSGDSGFPYALGGNTALVRTVTRSDGSTCAIGVCDTGLTPIVGLQMSIYNDQNSVANITAGQYVDLGDLWFSPCDNRDIDGDWKLSYKDSGGSAAAGRRSINGQPWPVLYPPARTLTCKRGAITFADAFIDGATPCYQSLRTLCGNGQVSVQIPRHIDVSTGALDVEMVHATAVFGTSEFSELDRGPGDYFSIGWQQQEIPALMA